MCEYCEGGKPIHECDNEGVDVRLLHNRGGSWVLDATGYYKNSYVNIRNITLGYTLPRAWMGRVVKKTRFYVTMNTPWRYSQFQNTGGISWWESFYIFGANVQF